MASIMGNFLAPCLYAHQLMNANVIHTHNGILFSSKENEIMKFSKKREAGRLIAELFSLLPPNPIPLSHLKICRAHILWNPLLNLKSNRYYPPNLLSHYSSHYPSQYQQAFSENMATMTARLTAAMLTADLHHSLFVSKSSFLVSLQLCSRPLAEAFPHLLTPTLNR